MRLLLEILIIGALIYVGWETPFRDRLPAKLGGASAQTGAEAPGSSTANPQLQPIVRSTPPPAEGGWMWDPHHHSVLDPPKKGSPPPRP